MSPAIIAGCIAIGTVASMLGVSTRTLRRWDAAGSLRPSFRTAGNHRRYDRHAVLHAIQHHGGDQNGHDASERAGYAAPRAAVYSRVSSTRQSLDGELDRQQHQRVHGNRERITIIRGFSLTTRTAKSWQFAKFVQNYS